MSSIDRPIRDLAQTDDFVSRHIGPRFELSEMLSEIGLSSMDALIEKAVPAAIFDGSQLTFRKVERKRMFSRSFGSWRTPINR